MTKLRFASSRPASCVSPRPYSDPSLRLRKYGPIQPMDLPRRSLLARLFGRNPA